MHRPYPFNEPCVYSPQKLGLPTLVHPECRAAPSGYHPLLEYMPCWVWTKKSGSARQHPSEILASLPPPDAAPTLADSPEASAARAVGWGCYTSSDARTAFGASAAGS